MAHHILSHLHKVLPQDQAWKMKVLQEWHTILGPLARKVVLQRIDDTAVILTVSHPSLAQELLMLTDLIKNKINAAIGKETITTIHFKTLAPRKDHSAATPAIKTAPEPKPRQPLTTLENKQLATISNKELRNALAEFYTTCKERTHS
jgi:hypothetical protein